ncbi:MAG: GTP-binding protein [Candidatus Peribacteria bacterium]|nr:GTP-binding protein [Candidatus Peribacteria bacterium]
MAKIPTVAIIGRPNTGKSTLFNRLIGRRRAIISDIPGTTRDHISSMVENDDLDYLLIDTGGMGGGTDDHDFEDDVHAQSLLAMEHADLILFTINSREELTANDHQVVQLLRKNRKQHVPVIIVLTKSDNPALLDALLPQYYQLGIADDIVAVSALNRVGVDELEDYIIRYLQKQNFEKQAVREQTEESTPSVAIIGKPNVGKSSLVNAMMSEAQRKMSPRLVSEIPGTTRDTTDTLIRYHDREFLFVDTAGLKRHAQTEEGIDSYAYLRTIQALEQSDIALMVLDATQPLAKQDKRVAALAIERGKGLIFLLNKIDLLTTEQKKEKIDEIKATFLFCRFAPVIPCSTVTREGLLKMFDLIEALQRNRTRRLAIKELNRWFKHSVEGQPLGPVSKAKHITQADAIPPTFVLFVKNPKEIEVSQIRFLDNRIRETFDFQGTPIRWIMKSGREREQ